MTDQNLVNAAPDLLAALKRLLSNFEECSIEDLNAHIQREAKKAIAKAEGKPFLNLGNV